MRQQVQMDVNYVRILTKCGESWDIQVVIVIVIAIPMTCASWLALNG